MKSMNYILNTLNQADAADTPTGWMNDRPHGPVTSDDPDAGLWEPKAPEPVKCPYCGQNQYYAGYYHGHGKVQWYLNTVDAVIPCKCDGMTRHIEKQRERYRQEREQELKERQERELKRLIEMNTRNAGMPEKFKRRTFETYQVKETNESAFKTCKAYAERFDELVKREQNGMALIGPIGTGKTHLAASIANALLQTGKRVICMPSVDMLAKIRATFKDDGNDDEIMNDLKTVDLLIIDDLGKEKATEWTSQTLYSIINARYENELPIIITTNYPLKNLVDRMTPNGSQDSITATAAVDRLFETCIEVPMLGPSWRKSQRGGRTV